MTRNMKEERSTISDLGARLTIALLCGQTGQLIAGDTSSHSSDNFKESISQHYPEAVAQSDDSYARKFGHYGRDSKRRWGPCQPFLMFHSFRLAEPVPA